MGREVRRVPLDFEWPLEKVWPGFQYETPDCAVSSCPEAEGSAIEWTKEAQCAFHQATWDGPYVKLDPPEGDGWQLWETVSEGSPISPVFDSAEALARWMSSPAYTWALNRLAYDQALRFVEAGWAPSMVFTPSTGVISGEAFIGGESA